MKTESWTIPPLKCVWCSKTTFNVYVSQRSRIQFEDEDHAVYISFLLSNNYGVFFENQNLLRFDCTQCGWGGKKTLR